MKQCIKCQNTKHVEEFETARVCKPCYADAHRYARKACRRCREYKKFPEEFGSKQICLACQPKREAYYERLQTRRKLSKTQKARDTTLRSLYGLSLEQYQQLRTAQAGCCKICGNPEGATGRQLFVDHDHKTGKVRGLLCVNCNLGIGNFQDDPDLLTKAAGYLKQP